MEQDENVHDNGAPVLKEDEVADASIESEFSFDNKSNDFSDLLESRFFQRNVKTESIEDEAKYKPVKDNDTLNLKLEDINLKDKPIDPLNKGKNKDEESENVILNAEDVEALSNRLGGLGMHKKGLQGLDKEEVNKMIYETSKGSKFFKNEAIKDAAVTARIKKILENYNIVKKLDLSSESAIVKAKLKELENIRDFTQTIVHIDMDAFYASIEERDNPELRTKPMAVGDEMMLATANYEARKYGVRSALPGYIARRLCPQLIIVPASGEKYGLVTSQIQEIFSHYDSTFNMTSMDEAYLNITKYLSKAEQTPDEVVQEIRQEISKKTGGLTASAGIACNMLLAKICSDLNKPNGQYKLENDRQSVMELMKDLNIRKIPGIGRVTERILNALDINTCGDLQGKLVIIHQVFTYTFFNFVARAALGIGSIDVAFKMKRKSMSVSRTFAALHKPADLRKKLRELAKHLEKDLAKHNFEGCHISLTLKMTSFKLLTRGRLIKKFIYSADDLYNYGKVILDAHLPLNLRSMGIRLTRLRSRDEPLKRGIKRYFDLQEGIKPKRLRSDTQSTSIEVFKENLPNVLLLTENTASLPLSPIKGLDNIKIFKDENNNVIGEPGSSSMAAYPEHKEMIKKHNDTTIAPPSSEINNIEKENPSWECPICGQAFVTLSNLRMNTHLDFCLGKEKRKNLGISNSKTKRRNGNKSTRARKNGDNTRNI
ncbi:10133_t:CDS:10 [Ambispora gerdemannii]|uniref:DNA polymerase kappa n=1 Tax=Ambispora gerdemannii TaxID=144530 RepID=A0A9N8V2W6_9GLOM|nr:10133_t:CDS:10 [Ambispora gerdemannii]